MGISCWIAESDWGFGMLVRAIAKQAGERSGPAKFQVFFSPSNQARAFSMSWKTMSCREDVSFISRKASYMRERPKETATCSKSKEMPCARGSEVPQLMVVVCRRM